MIVCYVLAVETAKEVYLLLASCSPIAVIAIPLGSLASPGLVMFSVLFDRAPGNQLGGQPYPR